MQQVSHIPDGFVFQEVFCERQGGTHMECDTRFKTVADDERRLTFVFRINDDAQMCDPRVQ